MRFLELEPRWFAEPGRHGQGVTFWCPHCKVVRLAVPFKNPVDGGAPVPLEARVMWPLLQPPPDKPDDKGVVTVPPGVHWTRTGDAFDSMTFHPSVDASRSGHWHGHVTAGAIVNAGP